MTGHRPPEDWPCERQRKPVKGGPSDAWVILIVPAAIVLLVLFVIVTSN